MSETIRIGVIGAGINTTLMHIPGFQAIDGVEVVSVANRSRESGQRVADQFGIPAVADTWADVIDDPDVDAICIGTWPYMHRTLVLAALDAGKHVLTEARMAMNAAEAHEMLDASLENPDLVAQVVPADFTFEVDQTIIDLINDGYLGDIVVADLAVHGGFMDRNAPYTWRNDRDMSGYNIMLMGAISECFMRWLGPPTSVTAQTRSYVPRRVDAGGRRKVTTIPDHVDILCELASGPVAHLRFTEVVGLMPAAQATLFGSEGNLRVDITMSPKAGDAGCALYGGRRGDSGLQRLEIPPEKAGTWRVEEEFINAIRGVEQVTHTTFEEGVRYMEFTEAVTRSAQTGMKVPLPL